MTRRFVNLVTASYRSRMYSLHRLDVSKYLFYPSTAEAEAAAAANADAENNDRSRSDGGNPPRIDKLRRLPEPSVRLQPYLQYGGMWSPGDMFSLLSPRGGGSGEAGRILHTSEDGHAILCDMDSCSTKTMPSLNLPKGWDPISFAVPGGNCAGAGEERLYVMRSDGPFNLEVLHLGHGSPEYKLHPVPHHFNRWHREFKWQPLPPIAENRYFRIMSSTLLGDGRIICVSALMYSKDDAALGTYCFDTETHEWWQAGDWLLPFDGRAVHVPELDTWLGFSPKKPCHLCAVDLTAVVMAPHQAPKVTHVLEDLNPPPMESMLIAPTRRFPTGRHATKEWQLMGYHLVNLGSGRFCVAKIFQVDKRVYQRCYSLHNHDSDEDTKLEDEFAVLTGVEVVRDGERGGLRMVKHKSKRYKFTSDCIKWVL
ncbi:hypothetical protein EJB05_15293, partial [Eragrostis curvula]